MISGQHSMDRQIENFFDLTKMSLTKWIERREKKKKNNESINVDEEYNTKIIKKIFRMDDEYLEKMMKFYKEATVSFCDDQGNDHTRQFLLLTRFTKEECDSWRNVNDENLNILHRDVVCFRDFVDDFAPEKPEMGVQWLFPLSLKDKIRECKLFPWKKNSKLRKKLKKMQKRVGIDTVNNNMDLPTSRMLRGLVTLSRILYRISSLTHFIHLIKSEQNNLSFSTGSESGNRTYIKKFVEHLNRDDDLFPAEEEKTTVVPLDLLIHNNNFSTGVKISMGNDEFMNFCFTDQSEDYKEILKNKLKNPEEYTISLHISRKRKRESSEEDEEEVERPKKKRKC